MRTAFFVDGYNLFYGLLADTPYKWLDLRSLLSHIAHIENPRSTTASVDYFTSSVKPSLATRGRVSKEAQDSYIRALKTTHIRVHYGHHQLEPAKAPRFVDRRTKASREDKVDIWKLEEKETDVHIAISMYRAAAKQTTLKSHERVEQLVLVSSDTDMTPALRALREDFPEITVGVILPHRAELNLKQHVHWMRRVVTCDELQSHQFPNRVPTHKAPAIKPDYW